MSEQERQEKGKELVGIKEIAAHMKCGLKTVNRYIASHGLPVYRSPTGRVMAYANEVDAWRRGETAEA